MNQVVEQLLAEMSKPLALQKKNVILGYIPQINAGDPNIAPMIYFLIDTLFDYAENKESSITMTELLKTIIANVTLLPALYQHDIKSDGSDPELDQMITFINSFKGTTH